MRKLVVEPSSRHTNIGAVHLAATASATRRGEGRVACTVVDTHTPLRRFIHFDSRQSHFRISRILVPGSGARSTGARAVRCHPSKEQKKGWSRAASEQPVKRKKRSVCICVCVCAKKGAQKQCRFGVTSAVPAYNTPRFIIYFLSTWTRSPPLAVCVRALACVCVCCCCCYLFQERPECGRARACVCVRVHVCLCECVGRA